MPFSWYTSAAKVNSAIFLSLDQVCKALLTGRLQLRTFTQSLIHDASGLIM